MTVEFAEVTAPDPQVLAEAAGRRAGNPEGDAAVGRLGVVVDWLRSCAADPRTPLLQRPRLIALGDTDLPSAVVLLAELVAVGVGHPDTEPPDDEKLDPTDPDAQVEAALIQGRTLADAEVDAGADLLIPLLTSVDRAAVLALAAAITGMEPVDVVGLDDDAEPTAWSALVGAVRDRLFATKSRGGDASSMLAAVDSLDLARLTGFCAQAALRRTPVILDGVTATVAGVLAGRYAPGANRYFVAAQEAPTRLGQRLQELLGLTALTTLGIPAENGSAALQAYSGLHLAVRVLA